MPYRTVAAVFLSLSLLPAWPAPATAADAKADLASNAALKYWRAFYALPALDKDQQKLLQEWDKVPLDAAALGLIEKSRLSRLDLLRGARLERCDWGLDLEDGFRMRLPHCGWARTLARLAALHARREFEQGRGKSGWEDVTALLKLARHVGIGPTFIGRLVGYLIETIAIDAAAPHLPELKSSLPRNAASVVAGLPQGPTIQEMVLSEKQIGVRWLLKELKEVEKRRKGAWKDVWKEIFDQPENLDRELARSVKTFEQAVKALEDLLPVCDRLAKLTARSWKEFDEQYPDFVKKAKAANPLAALVLPNLEKILARERQAQARLAMFQAALAVVQGGRDRLKDFEDPFGKGPFEYRALDKGFELKSKLLFKGQPVTLTVGKGKKK
jgi:hypothetical protein